ncbi:DUF2721 domain-containing protein [Fulvivirga sedimenti]|uniref:DUF2721 domain-containing protein n=1 Tax=Fulvivirga sedimenti TaxID=2879465 RepID=A0A9X1HMC3_9BACT|nr:DUF2721 domain-containing protein [Fulvivirga sedimenti]MCA6073227.1 DUF2721 domain-containing protein [Fulvivirga sedimenti]
MQINITTPALLFPAISLLLLAYTNRFLAIATLIRNLNKDYHQSPEKRNLVAQINNLKLRLLLIRNMQIFGVVSFFLCVLSMFMLFSENPLIGNYIFGGSLITLLISLGISIYEIQISTRALNIDLGEMER